MAMKIDLKIFLYTILAISIGIALSFSFKAEAAEPTQPIYDPPLWYKLTFLGELNEAICEAAGGVWYDKVEVGTWPYGGDYQRWGCDGGDKWCEMFPGLPLCPKVQPL